MEPLYAILAGLIPSLVWLIFWTREDSHPEPKWLIGACFLGGVLAVVCAITGEKIAATLIADEKMRYIVWSALEEIFKFTAVLAIALGTRNNDEPIDAMMYCITVALGFAALENTLFVMRQIGNGSSLLDGLNTGNLRFIGPTLLHTVSSALIGFSYGYVFFHSKFLKFFAILIGLAEAVAVHATFNLSILNANPDDTLKSFAWVWFAVVILIVLFEEIKVVRPVVPVPHHHK